MTRSNTLNKYVWRGNRVQLQSELKQN